MWNPLFWMVIEYLVTAPFFAVLRICILGHRYKELKKDQVWTAGILGVLMLVSAIKGLDGLVNMFPPMILIFCFGLWFSAFLAVKCVRKKDAEKLETHDIVLAVGTYFLFLVFTILSAPHIRYCEGCMEWH